MGMHSKWVNSNLVYFDGQTWVDAVGPNVCKFLEDFVGTPFASADNMAAWVTTLVEGGAGETTVALGTDAGGCLVITTDAADNDGANLQVASEAFKLVSGKPLYFGIRLKTSEATQSDFFAGLAITDTDILGAVTDSIGFKKVDASTAILFELNKDSTATSATVATLAANTYVTLEFMFDGTNVDSYVNGTLQTRLAMTNLPDDEELTPSIQFLAGSVGAKTCTIDWIKCIQINA